MCALDREPVLRAIRCDRRAHVFVALSALWLAVFLTTASGLSARLGERLVVGDGPAGAERTRVVRVVDGDTVIVEDGHAVRVLGLDAPETHNPALRGPQPLGNVASARLTELVGGRAVALEVDVTPGDHYGRRLRHLWVGHTLIAEVLVREGLAWAMSVPPDVKHADRLRAAEAAARAARRGIWGLPRPTSLPIFATPAS
jgi:micrococcal nuclease